MMKCILSFKQPVINELSEGGLLVFLKSSLHQPFCFLEPCIILMSFVPLFKYNGNDDTDGVKFSGTSCVLGARLSVFHVLTRMILTASVLRGAVNSVIGMWNMETEVRRGQAHRLLSLF